MPPARRATTGLVATLAILLLAVPTVAQGRPEPPSAAAAQAPTGFTDVAEHHAAAVAALVAADIAEGCAPERFCPEDRVTRAELADLVVEGFDLPLAPDDQRDAFGDDDGTRFEPSIDALAAAGLTGGCTRPDTFCPDRRVRRGQLAALLTRAQSLSGGTDYFADDDGSPLEAALEAAAVAGITEPCARFRSCPEAFVTRGEVATQLARALWLVERPQGPPTRGRLEGMRLVALYGKPQGPVLGVLGEQDLEATIDRARELAAEYEGLGSLTPKPTLEIITTLAIASAGQQGDYSLRLEHDVLREWVDAAAEAGVEVVLDLQPGRTSFLDQAEQLEEFLVEPHVGLALDPEWRLEPDEFHMRQIGSVSIEEVNATGKWFAELAESEDLPQQLFLLHQFRVDMIPDRHRLEDWPELHVVIQMDGQGPQSTKLDTWGVLTRDPPPGAAFGWKNFYDEDTPTRSQADTAAVEPSPVFVSYQ